MDTNLEDIFENSTGAEALRRVVDAIRPAGDADTEEIDERIYELIDTLRGDEELLCSFQEAARQLFGGARLVHAFAESGILSEVGFFREVRSRVVCRFLPKQLPPGDVRRQVNTLFRKHDWRWVTAASAEAWAELVALVAEQQGAWEHPNRDLAAAIQGLAQRIGALGIDEELNAKLYEVEDYDSPFLDLTIQAHAFVSDTDEGQPDPEHFDTLMETVRECRDMIVYLRRNKRIFGTNLRLTAVTRRLLQQLDRLELLAHLHHPESSLDLVASTVRLFRELLEAEQTSNSVRRLFKESADLLAFQITEQSARKGQKYITESRKGYFKFLRAALFGGAIVAPFAIFKVLLSHLPLSLAAEALLYSLNYSACFVLIYMTGSILATKQPAVTASAITQKMDEATTEQGALEGVADVIILVWRSQFISFVGNLAAALPLGWLIAMALARWWQNPVVNEAGAAYLFDSVHPWASGALFFAGIAGVCLFLAGVISGWVDNHVIYSELEERLASHPSLAFLGGLRDRLAGYVGKHFGMLCGNVALGFMLGCAGPLGIILGLPFDIRHIAFSSAHVGVAAFTLPAQVLTTMGLIAAVGIIGIGFFNFLISFMLTMVTGLESRQVTFPQTRQLVAILVRRLIKRPWDWFYPPKKPRYRLPAAVPEEDVAE
jgi:site-specific recombinase